MAAKKAKKAPAKKAPAKKATAKKATVKKATVKKAPPRKVVKKAPPKKQTKAAAPKPRTEADSFTISATPLKKGKIGGRLEMSKKVVAAIANYTARRVPGIYDLGKAGMLYRSIGTDPTRGVDAEVGEKQAALDIEVVIEYGCNLAETVEDLRGQIAEEVFKMAGREVVEINIKVSGIHLPGDDD